MYVTFKWSAWLGHVILTCKRCNEKKAFKGSGDVSKLCVWMEEHVGKCEA